MRKGVFIGSCWVKQKGDHWGVVGKNGWIIIGRTSGRWNVGVWAGFGWPRIETVGGRM